MPFVKTLSRKTFLFIGDVSVRFEHYDAEDNSVMLVIGDPSKHWLHRHRTVTLKAGESTTLPNGAFVQLDDQFTQKSAVLRITSDLPIREHKEMMAERQTSRPDAARLH